MFTNSIRPSVLVRAATRFASSPAQVNNATGFWTAKTALLSVGAGVGAGVAYANVSTAHCQGQVGHKLKLT